MMYGISFQELGHHCLKSNRLEFQTHLPTTNASQQLSQGINFYMLGRRIMSRQFEPLPAGYSSEMGQLVDAMLQLEPSHRPSAADILSVARARVAQHATS